MGKAAEFARNRIGQAVRPRDPADVRLYRSPSSGGIGPVKLLSRSDSRSRAFSVPSSGGIKPRQLVVVEIQISDTVGLNNRHPIPFAQRRVGQPVVRCWPSWGRRCRLIERHEHRPVRVGHRDLRMCPEAAPGHRGDRRHAFSGGRAPAPTHPPSPPRPLLRRPSEHPHLRPACPFSSNASAASRNVSPSATVSAAGDTDDRTGRLKDRSPPPCRRPRHPRSR